jgi:hypothetical protein
VHESMLDYGNRRYLKVALSLCAVSIVAYAVHDPLSPPNGGTWLGYTLGGIGAALIIWLTALGIRKRSYASSLGTLRGWTSAHVYLGLSLIVVATLHTGFQFGWNLHTLCYVLMLIVIASGMFGTVVYLRYPQLMSSNRAGLKPDVLREEINDLDQRCLRVASEMPRRFGEVLRSNREGTRVGGGTRAILGGLDFSNVDLPAAGGGVQKVPNVDQVAVLDWLGNELARSDDGELVKRIGDLLSAIASRRNHLRRLRRDAQIRGWLEIWLYIHVPVTLALIGTLIAHVVSVFLYW